MRGRGREIEIGRQINYLPEYRRAGLRAGDSGGGTCSGIHSSTLDEDCEHGDRGERDDPPAAAVIRRSQSGQACLVRALARRRVREGAMASSERSENLLRGLKAFGWRLGERPA